MIEGSPKKQENIGGYPNKIGLWKYRKPGSNEGTILNVYKHPKYGLCVCDSDYMIADEMGRSPHRLIAELPEGKFTFLRKLKKGEKDEKYDLHNQGV